LRWACREVLQFLYLRSDAYYFVIILSGRHFSDWMRVLSRYEFVAFTSVED
jgi:hypothetical protein